MDKEFVSKCIEGIPRWLNQYCEANGQKGFVVGLSGGIDSALTSTLCAMTNKPVVIVTMPIHNYGDGPAIRALQHISWLTNYRQYLNVSHSRIELRESFDVMKKALPPVCQEDDLVLANMASRLRMITLYAIASKGNLLVVGTGNKVEDFGVGFFTKYGDGGVDISPIADLTKSQVYDVAKGLEISLPIREAAPTDGLWGDGRTDEDQLGATYKELEWAMSIEESLKAEEMDGIDSDLNLTERQAEVLKIYRDRHKANRHKMDPIPVCKISELQ